MLVSLSFEKNGTCELLVGAEHQMKEDGVPIDIMGSVSVPGTYTLNGKDLTMDLNRGKAEVDFDYKIKGMDAKTKALMDKQIRNELNSLKGEFKKTMLDGMPKMHNMRSSSSPAKNSPYRLIMDAKCRSTHYNGSLLYTLKSYLRT